MDDVKGIVLNGRALQFAGNGGGESQIYGNDTHNAEFIRLGEIIGAPIVGHIGDGKVITLKGDLPKGVYTFQIVKADGSTAKLCTYEVV